MIYKIRVIGEDKGINVIIKGKYGIQISDGVIVEWINYNWGVITITLREPFKIEKREEDYWLENKEKDKK